MTNLHPLALVGLLVAAFIVICGKRHQAIATILVMAAIVPLGQRISVLTLDFTFLRVLVFLAWARALLRGEYHSVTVTKNDKLFFIWGTTCTVCWLIRSPSAEALGFFYDAFGVYSLSRVLAPNPTEITRHLLPVGLSMLLIAAGMTVEWKTRNNVFHVFGGVPETSDVRNDRVRSQGPFRHPILAGCFGATLFPLFLGIWPFRRRNSVVAAAAVASVVVVATSASSGSLMTWLSAVCGLLLWPVRHRVRLVGYLGLLSVLALALIMDAPVWYLMDRLGGVIGGGGWWRAYVIDIAFQHIDEWWLMGTSYTAHWAPAGLVLLVNPNMIDLTNHYIVQGVTGGIWGLLLFLWLIRASVCSVGVAIQSTGKESRETWLYWTVGVAIASHCTAFLSVSYYDNIVVYWYWLLALVAGLNTKGRDTSLQ